MPWFWAAFPIGLTLVGVAAGWWSAWRRLAVSASPGMVIRAGLRDDALVIEDSTVATISYRGVDRMFVMRNAVLVRSQLRSVVLFPRAVTPDVEAPSRAGRGGVVQEPPMSSSRNDTAHRRSPGVWVCRAPRLAVASRVASGPGRPCRRKHLCGGGSTC